LSLLTLVLGLAYGVAPAVGGTNPTQIVQSDGSTFSVETLDGTVTTSVAAAAGTYAENYAAAANGSIVYDDGIGSTADGGNGGPVWLVGPSQTPLELDSSPDDFGASISYDGSKVTFARYNPATGSSDIYVVDADGSNLALVKSGEGSNYFESPEFSPDGGSIAYICTAASNPVGNSLGCGPTSGGAYYKRGIMLMSSDGTNSRMIVLANLDTAVGDSLSWSPDGKSIATPGCPIAEVGGAQSCFPKQIFVYRTDGSDLLNDSEPSAQVTNEPGEAVVEPQFNIDGSAILFMKAVDNNWVPFSIDPDGTNEYQLDVSPGFKVVPPATGGGPPPLVEVSDPPVTGAGTPVVFKSPFTLPQCNGFLIEAGDGALTDCVSVPTGALNFSSYTTFSVAADDSIVYDDVNHGATDANGDSLRAGAGPVWLVGPSRAPLELDSSPYDFDAAVSPDGSEVVFARFDPDTLGSDLFVVGANGSGLTRVASGGGNNLLSAPKFSPDLGSIGYRCAPAGSPAGTGLGCGPTPSGAYDKRGVVVMNADGSDQRMIVSGASTSEWSDTFSWSPDGQWVTVPGCVQFVQDVGQCGSDQAFAYRTDGSDAFDFLGVGNRITDVAQSPGASLEPQFCGSSTQILFQTSWTSGFDEPSSYVIGRDGTNQHEISLWPGGDPGRAECVPPATGGGPAHTVSVAEPLPFPDGQVAVKSTIPQCNGFLVETATDSYTDCIQATPAFESTVDHFPYDVAADHSVVFTEYNVTGIWLARPGKDPVQIDASPDDRDPVISPDGSEVAFRRSDPNSPSDIYVMNADGSGVKLVASGSLGQGLVSPAFSPDGSAIAYIVANSGVMLMNADGSNKRMIVSGRFSGPLSWSPDAKWVALNNGQQIYAYHTDGSDLFDGADAQRQVTHETDQWGPGWPQFSPDGSQILYERNVDDSGNSVGGVYWYAIHRDGTNRHEVFLTPDPYSCSASACTGDFAWGVFVRPRTGGPVPKPARPTQATVPDVHALGLHTAKRRLARVRLTGKVKQQRYSSHVQRGHVISQFPRARAQASLKKKRTRTVKLVVSRGPRPHKKR
jgi:Tol biopolymer transport system component